jgi:hypothetical protein
MWLFQEPTFQMKVSPHLPRSEIQLLVTPNVVPSSPILATLMMEAIHFFETSALTRGNGIIPKKMVLFIVTAVETSISHFMLVVVTMELSRVGKLSYLFLLPCRSEGIFAFKDILYIVLKNQFQNILLFSF